MADSSSAPNSSPKKLPTILLLAIVLCLTLGLAPFRPEPHLFGKIKWILGGAAGMQAVDWLDFFLHLSPFILLLFIILKKKKAKE